MKKIWFVLLVAATLMSCEKEGGTTIDATIIGRWQAVGFDDVIRHEFTSDKRFTLYNNGEGVFPTLEEFMEQNPGLSGNDWYYDCDTVVVDLNFGNFSRLVPRFKCDNYAIDWIDREGATNSTFYREGYNIAECN